MTCDYHVIVISLKIYYTYTRKFLFANQNICKQQITRHKHECMHACIYSYRRVNPWDTAGIRK